MSVARRLFAALVAAAALAGGGCGGPDAAHARPDLASVESFAFALGERPLQRPMEHLGDYDLVVVDGEDATAAQVAQLRADGAVVLAYLSVGTVENWRSWYPQVRAYGLEAWDDWEGERYADTSKAGFRDAVVQEIAPAILAKGFDGLFLDNVAMVEDHPRQHAGMVELVARLDVLAGPDRLLFAQNGEEVMRPFLAHLDGWNREDVSLTYDFARRRYVPTPAGERRAALRAIRAMRARGLLVTATDYAPRSTNAAARRAITAACAAGAVAFVSDIGLNRVPRAAARCPR